MDKRAYDPILQAAAKLSPSLTLPPEANDKASALALLEAIKKGKHPLTREGVVVAGPDMPTTKVKFAPEYDVLVKNVFKALTKAGPDRAGGFTYADPSAPDKELGRVGSGMTRDMAIRMLKHPQDFEGTIARVKAQERFPSGALRAPRLIGPHFDKVAAGTEYGIGALERLVDHIKPPDVDADIYRQLMPQRLNLARNILAGNRATMNLKPIPPIKAHPMNKPAVANGTSTAPVNEERKNQLVKALLNKTSQVVELPPPPPALIQSINRGAAKFVNKYPQFQHKDVADFLTNTAFTESSGGKTSANIFQIKKPAIEELKRLKHPIKGPVRKLSAADQAYNAMLYDYLRSRVLYQKNADQMVKNLINSTSPNASANQFRLWKNIHNTKADVNGVYQTWLRGMAEKAAYLRGVK